MIADIDIIRHSDGMTAAGIGFIAGAAINTGEPVKFDATTKQVIPLATGEGSDATPFGIALNTVTAGDRVVVRIPQNEVFEIAATDWATNLSTQILRDAVLGNVVTLALTAGVYTIDEADASAATNGLIIVGFDAEREKVQFIVNQSARLTQAV